MQTGRRRGIASVLAGACLAMTGGGAWMVRAHLPDRFPFQPWSAADTVVWVVAVTAGVTLSLAGAWLLWRLPSHPTGWWVLATAAAFGCWLLLSYWPGALSSWADRLLPTLFKATIVVAVLPWPTGRLERRWSRTFTPVVVLFVLIGWMSEFVGYRPSPWDGRQSSMPHVGTSLDAVLASTVTSLLLQGLAPAVFLAAIVRRHATMPPSVRSSTRPALVGAALLAVTELWIFASDALLGPLRLQGLSQPRLGTFRDAVDLGRFAVVGGLLVVAEVLRRRAALRSVYAQRVELGPSEVAVDPSTEVARLLHDPSARLVAPGSEDRGRACIEIEDGGRRVVAVLEHDPAVDVTAAIREAVLGAVEVAVIRRTRQADADRHAAELRTAQRALLDAQDRSRTALERDLHDGVQQRLVALALEASMLARREAAGRRDARDRERLVESIDATAAFARAVVMVGRPAVLEAGLAAGLAALDAAVPIPSTLTVEGDLPGNDRVAEVLWFVASEAIANTLKHARATELGVELHVDDRIAELVVVDDGVGGAPDLPESILRRLAGVPAEVDVESAPGRGTTVRVCVDLAREEARV